MNNKSPSELDISIIIPVYNERDNLVPLEKKLEKVLSKLKLSYEIILVDDGLNLNGENYIKVDQAEVEECLSQENIRLNNFINIDELYY